MARPRSTALVAARPGGLDGRTESPGQRLKLQRWVDTLPVRRSALVSTGLGIAALGLTGLFVNPLGLAGIVVCSSMFTVGTGLSFLALNKRSADEGRAPSAEERSVVAERARRVRAAMRERSGDWTFEQLHGRMRWTEEALVSALLYLRESGEVVEDLDLDTGRWVYRFQDPELVPRERPSLMLDERRADDGAPDG